MKKIIISGLALNALLIFSCSKTSVEALNNTPGNPTTCDTVNMKYATNVVPILTDFCYACHGANTNSGSGGIILEGYENIRPRAISGTLMGVISHSAGFPQMPKDGPKLSDCNINKIRSWINNGAQDN
jgi:hypothetical protein